MHCWSTRPTAGIHGRDGQLHINCIGRLRCMPACRATTNERRRAQCAELFNHHLTSVMLFERASITFKSLSSKAHNAVGEATGLASRSKGPGCAPSLHPCALRAACCASMVLQ